MIFFNFFCPPPAALAMQHMDLKQVELDTAVAKVDELSRQLESLWTDGPGPPKVSPGGGAQYGGGQLGPPPFC